VRKVAGATPIRRATAETVSSKVTGLAKCDMSVILAPKAELRTFNSRNQWDFFGSFSIQQKIMHKLGKKVVDQPMKRFYNQVIQDLDKGDSRG
jgi:hypothetical protein